MSKEIKAGDWVRVSDESEDDAQQTSILYQVTGFTHDGRVMTNGCCPWKYAVHPNEVKVLPLKEYESLLSNQMSNIENLEVGQELTIGQAAEIAEYNGSTDILEYFDDDLSRFMKCGNNNCIYIGSRYRLAPKKVNNPDDPTSWENGVAIFARNSEYDAWSLDVFSCYKENVDFKYVTDFNEWRYAKLATPVQIEAWKLINDEWEYAT